MRARQRSRPHEPAPSEQKQQRETPNLPPTVERSPIGAALHWATLLIVLLHASYFIYYFQIVSLPKPLSPQQAGKRGFSEHRAYAHVKYLSSLGPHPVGSQALDGAVEYVLGKVEEVQTESPWDVDVEVDFFHAKPGVTSLAGGLFKGKSLVYTNLNHVVVRVKPTSVSGAENNSILISSHIDSVITSPGAGDCNSNIGVMLELLRAVSHWGHGFKHSVIFLFNTGEEEGLDGAHGFITQHPWSSSIRTFVDLEAIGVGGKSILFQAGPNGGIVEFYGKVAKYPAAQITAQDIFQSGFIKSATDFQVYQEIGNLSGLDFAFMKNVAVYHTKNDKIELLTPGSLQHIGENMLSLIREVAVSDALLSFSSGSSDANKIIYFDILGKYFVSYSKTFGKQFYVSAIGQSVLLLLMSLFQGGWNSVKSLLLSLACILYSWIFAVTFSFIAGYLLPFLSYAAVPYLAHPWLALGLFGSPALIGALIGHMLGYKSLRKYLFRVRQVRTQKMQESFKETDLKLADLRKSSKETDLKLATWDTERWLFKAGILQWLGILILGTWLNIGTTYISLFWVLSPGLAYGIIDATFSPQRAPRELKTITLLAAMVVPLMISAGWAVQLFDFMIGNLARFDRNPGATPDFIGNLLVAALAAALVCLFLVFLLPYAHRSGGFKWILSGLVIIYVVALALVTFQVIPPFTQHFSRTLHVTQIVQVNTSNGVKSPTSYVSISSAMPGKLTREFSYIKDEGFVCGEGDAIDMVTFTVKYGCTCPVALSSEELNALPKLELSEEKVVDSSRVSLINMNMTVARRWVLAINTTNLSFIQLEGVDQTTGEKQILIPKSTATSVNGWHQIQFVTDQYGPSYFQLSLFWSTSTAPRDEVITNKPVSEKSLLLKLRTDVNKVTPKLQRTLERLPEWTSMFGKSTSPYPLAYLVNLEATNVSA